MGEHTVMVTLLGSLAAAAIAAELPDPYARLDEPTIGPAPIPVMEQVLWVELPVPPENTRDVQAPEGVTLLDRTKPGAGRARTRIYFRSDRGVREGTITVRLTDGTSVSVPLRVRTYREDIQEQIKAVPGVDPAVRKAGRSYYTDEMLEIAKENLQSFPSLGDRIRASMRQDRMSDEELFAFLPSWNVPRQCYSNWPCPYCGEAIYSQSAFYPWKYSSGDPFKARCPKCERLFPTNDFPADDFTSGDYPDDGWGWDPGTGERPDFAGWIAYYNHRAHWESIGGALIAQRC